MVRRSAFVSYHHGNYWLYKDSLCTWNQTHGIFEDLSVNSRDIPDDLPDQTIRKKIRDEYLRDSTVTIVLVGTGTRRRKHVDWEIYSSMFDGAVNKKSGILVINLPTINCTFFTAAHAQPEKDMLYPNEHSWISLQDNWTEYERRYPYMPDRLLDNIVTEQAYISVVDWRVATQNPTTLRWLIEMTHVDRTQAVYDLSRQLRRNNS